MQLTSKTVQEIFEDCEYKETDINCEPINVKGVMAQGNFHPSRIAANRYKISGLIDQLYGIDGVVTFDKLKFNKDEVQWTELYSDENRVYFDIDKLVLLGLAIKELKFYIPRELWHTRPGFPQIMKEFVK